MTLRVAVDSFISRAAVCSLVSALAFGQSQAIPESTPNAKLERLRVQVQRQGFEKTEQELQRSLQKHGAVSSVIESLALLYVDWKKPDRVVLLANQISPQEEDVALGAARVLTGGGYLEHANQFLQSFLPRSNVFSWKLTDLRATVLIELGRHDEVIKILTAVPEGSEKEPARYYRLALANQGLGRWNEALSHIRKALQIQPDPVYIYTEGLLLLTMDKLPEAQRVFAEGRKRFPNSPQLCLGHARLYSKVGDFYRVESSLRKAIELDPNYGEAYAHLGRLFYLVGDWESFRPTIQRAIELQPHNFLACYYYGQLILLDGGEQAQERALELFKKSVQFEKTFAAGYIASGQILANQGNGKEALEFYQQAAQKDPRNNRVYYLMAQAYRSLGQLDEAKRSLERAGLSKR